MLTAVKNLPSILERVQAEVVMVTPAMAREWLSQNVRNRELRESNLEKLRTNIRHMGWQLTPDAIAFDTEGVLRNGQHRLHIIAKGTEAVPCLVVKGLPLETHDATDRGRPRTLEDQLHWRGEKAAKRLSPVIRLLYQYEQTGAMRHNSGGTTYADSLLSDFFYDGRYDLRDYVRQWHAPMFLPDTALSVMNYCFAKAQGDDEADEFMRGLLKGAGLMDTDPRYVVRERLLRANAIAHEGGSNPRLFTLTKVERRALVVKAFNKWIAGEEVTSRSLTWRAGGANPEPFPLVAGYPHFHARARRQKPRASRLAPTHPDR